MAAAPDKLEGTYTLDCNASSIGCFSYEDPTTLERAGGRLFSQACCCPAAVLAANASLLEGEGPNPQLVGIPCSGGLAIGPKGEEAHAYLRESQCLSRAAEQSSPTGTRGPLAIGLTRRQAIAASPQSKDVTASRHERAAEEASVSALAGDGFAEVTVQGPARGSSVHDGQGNASVSLHHTSLSFTMANPGAAPLESPDLLAGKAKQHEPTNTNSSAESRSTPASSSIPPPEVTDSPRMGGPAPDESYAASSVAYLDEANGMLADSASFPVPAALPLPSMVRTPPTYAVPAALKPPDSADSEVMRAWMQGPKLSHLPQFQPGEARPESAAPQASPLRLPTPGLNMSGSEASLFSVQFDAAAPSPLPRPTPPHLASTAASIAASEGGRPVLGGSRDLQGDFDTITSSRLSSMIDHAMLNGSGSSAGRASGAAPGAAPSPAAWDSCRQSMMAPIAEVDGEDATSSQRNSTLESRAQDCDSVGVSPANSLGPGNGTWPSSRRAMPTTASNARYGATGVRGGGGSGSWRGGSRAVPTTSGSRVGGNAGRAAPAAVGGLNGAALTALARMGSDCASSTGPSGSAVRAVPRRNAPGTSSGSGVAGGAASPQPAASQRRSRKNDDDDGVGTSGDNFSSPLRGAALQHQAPAPYYGSTAQPAYGDDDDEVVNMASIRPSFLDEPGLEHFKEALRMAGERADAEAAAAATPVCNAVPTPAASAASPSASVTSARVMTIPQRAAVSSRYGGGGAAPATSGRPGFAGRSALPYMSMNGEEGPSQEETGGTVSEEASSAIDGPVSSQEASSANGPHRAGSAARRSAAAEEGPDADHEEDAYDPGDVPVEDAYDPGEASVSLGVSTVNPSLGGRSLSNGESNAAYDSTADSVAISQHRQKHWVNWMAQSGMSVGMSRVMASQASAMTRPMGTFGGRANRAAAEPAGSYNSVNQRTPHPVPEEEPEVSSSADNDRMYGRWR